MAVFRMRLVPMAVDPAMPGSFAISTSHVPGTAIATGFLNPLYRCSPHSVLSESAQRPERGSAPGATLRVQGMHPIDG